MNNHTPDGFHFTGANKLFVDIYRRIAIGLGSFFATMLAVALFMQLGARASSEIARIGFNPVTETFTYDTANAANNIKTTYLEVYGATGKGVSAADIYLTENPAGSIIAIGNPDLVGCDAELDVLVNTRVEGSTTPGTAPRIAFTIKKTTGNLPDLVRIPVKYRATAPGVVTLGFDPATTVSGNVGGDSDRLYTVQQMAGNYPGVYTFKTTTGEVPTNTPTPVPGNPGAGDTPTPVPGSAQISLTLKVALQGIVVTKEYNNGNRNPLDFVKTTQLPFTVTLAGSNKYSVTQQNVAFNLDKTTGIWTGTATFTAPAGSGYRVYVKGPKHLRRELCSLTGADTNNAQNPDVYRCKPSESLTLTAGNNVLDFSKVILFAGDLKLDNAQDGIISAQDIGYILNAAGDITANENKSVTDVADLNYDGVVNRVDLGMLRESLGVRYDDSIKTF